MDLLKRGCSGSTFCRYTKIFQRACISILSSQRLLPTTVENALCYNFRTRPNISYRCYCAEVNTNFEQNGCLRYLQCYKHKFTCANIARFYCSGFSLSNSSVKLFSSDWFGSESNNQLNINNDILMLKKQIKEALACGQSDIEEISNYYFQDGGKFIRPTVVLLMSRLCLDAREQRRISEDCNSILKSQKKIALISEMIHAASLLHDDVVDEADIRRSRATANQLWGNKKSILVGDYILARATKILASIRNPEVIVQIAQVIEELVYGEFMQLTSATMSGAHSSFDKLFEKYMEKTYKKTASLFAHSCQAVAMLANIAEHFQVLAYEYGKHLGLAFQLIDDMLDFMTNTNVVGTGKSSLSDVKLGIATAPVLFASLQHPILQTLIHRCFSAPGDDQLTLDLVHKSDGILKTKQLAAQHANFAAQKLELFPNSDFKQALIEITDAVVNRRR